VGGASGRRRLKTRRWEGGGFVGEKMREVAQREKTAWRDAHENNTDVKTPSGVGQSSKFWPLC